SIDSNPKFILTGNGAIKSSSPVNVLLSFKADDQLGQFLRRNDFSQEYEFTQDVKIGRTTFKQGELPANFNSVVTVYFENVLGIVYSDKAFKAGFETFMSERS
ncbi:hypothetical protein ABXW34_18395, partial [Streptococcus suis]